MTSTTVSSSPGQYTPLREMILDNCAVFKKISSKSVMIVTEKRPTGQIVACAMVRGVTPGTIVCSDPSDSLGGALASLHDKSMRTVHSHRNVASGTLRSSNRRPTQLNSQGEDEDEDDDKGDSDDDDWLSDYDVLSETSDDQYDDSESSDTDGEDVPILTPATTTATTTTTTSGNTRPVVVPWARPDCVTYAISCPHRFTLLPPVRVCGSCVKPPTVLRQTANSPGAGPKGWVPVGVSLPGSRCQLAARQSHYSPVMPERQPHGQPQQQQQQQIGLSRQAQLRRDETLQHDYVAAISGPGSSMQNLNGPNSTLVAMPRQKAPSNVKISPVALPPAPNDAVFDVAFVVNWRQRSRHGFLAKSRAGIRALQVVVLDYCMQHSTAFKGQLASAPALAAVRQSPDMPAPVAVAASGITESETGSERISGVNSAAQDEGEVVSAPPSAAQPAPPGLIPSPCPHRRMPVSTTASLMRPIPLAPRHGGMVWWSGGWLKAELLSAGAGDAASSSSASAAAAIKYDLRAYTGDDLGALFRMCMQSGSVPTVEVDIELTRRCAPRV